MAGSGFRTNYRNGPIVPNGRLLNEYGSALNALVPAVGGSNLDGYSGDYVGPKRQIIGVAEILSAADDGLLSTDGELQPPYGTKHKYTCAFRYWDETLKAWLTLQTEMRLDSSIYRDGQRVDLPHGGAIPLYVAGDAVAAIYDPVSEWCVPLDGPPTQQGSITFFSQESMELPRGLYLNSNQSAYNTAQFAIELMSGYGIVTTPIFVGTAGSTTSTFVVQLPLRHYDLFRVKAGLWTNSRSRHGLMFSTVTIKWLGRGKNKMATFTGQLPGEPINGYGLVHGYEELCQAKGRTRDVPKVRTIQGGSHFLVEMMTPDDEWLAEVTLTVRTARLDAKQFVRIIDESFNPGGLIRVSSTGDVEARGYLVGASGDIRQDQQEGRDMRVAAVVLDYVQMQQGTHPPVINGRLYGPVEIIDFYPDDLTPIVGFSMGYYEYTGVIPNLTGDETVKKGSVREFELLDEDGSPSGITVSAVLRFNEHEAGKKCRLWRDGTVWIANQIEC